MQVVLILRAPKNHLQAFIYLFIFHLFLLVGG